MKTKEPLIHLAGDKCLYTRLKDGCRGIPVARVISESPEHQANADRLAECWNAMLGIESPAALRKETVEVLEWIYGVSNGEIPIPDCMDDTEALQHINKRVSALLPLWRAQGNGRGE